MQYIALLRGINVGGNNIIKMADLRVCFEHMGFSDVRTYIQSGNVIFRSESDSISKLTQKIEETLSGSFQYKSTVVVISEDDLRHTVDNAPAGFGEEPEKFKYDVLFLKSPLAAGVAMKDIKVREGVDSAHPGRNVIYFSRLIEKAGKSYLNKLISTPIYKEMTIRNWRTTNKLFEMLSQ